MISTAQSELRMSLVESSGRAITRAKLPGTSPSGTATMRYSTPASDTPDRAENSRPSRATASSCGPSTSRSLSSGTKNVLPSAR